MSLIFQRKITVVSFCFLLAACGGGSSNTVGTAASDGNASGTGPSTLPAGAETGSTGASANTGTTGTTGPASPNGTADNGGNATSPSEGAAGNPGSASAAATFVRDETARFDGPADINSDATGNLYVLDKGSKRIRKIATDGHVSTLPVSLVMPLAMDIDVNGNLYVNDNNAILKITPSGAVSTFLAESARGYMTVDADGNVYFFSYGSIRRVGQDGVVRTVFTTQATVAYRGLAVDAAGNLYTAIYENYAGAPLHIVKISPAGVQTDFAPFDFRFGPSTSPDEIANMSFDTAGNLYVAHYRQHSLSPGCGESNSCYLGFYESGMAINKITPDGTVTSIRTGPPGSTGSIDEIMYDRDFGKSYVAVGKDGELYATYSANETVYKVAQSGATTLIAGTPGEAGSSD